MMRIAEYDDVDPLQVLHTNLLCLDFALTPELVRLIRRMDPRPFPFFALYALEGNTVTGQVGVFRLPVVSAAGATEVGGVWAVSTHPAWRGRGVASLLLNEAHARMAAAGLRFSTLGTDRFRVAHRLYQKHGYHDLYAPAATLGPSAALPRRPDLRAERAGVQRLELADRLFEQIARGQLGFARRHTPFFPFLHARGALDAEDLWLLWRGDELAGYAAVSAGRGLLRVRNLLLAAGLDAPAAAATLAQATDSRTIQVRLDRSGDAASFAQAGFQVTPESWGTLMVKPLAADVTVAEFSRLHGLEHGQFLVSYLDTT